MGQLNGYDSDTGLNLEYDSSTDNSHHSTSFAVTSTADTVGAVGDNCPAGAAVLTSNAVLAAKCLIHMRECISEVSSLFGRVDSLRAELMLVSQHWTETLSEMAGR